MSRKLTRKEERELYKEWYGPGGKLEESGFEDVEAYRPDKFGPTREPLLGKGQRLVSLDSFMASLDGDYPEDNVLFDFHDSARTRRYDWAEALALRAIITLQPWELCVALALFCEGVSERESAMIMGRSRGTVRKLLSESKKMLPRG